MPCSDFDLDGGLIERAPSAAAKTNCQIGCHHKQERRGREARIVPLDDPGPDRVGDAVVELNGDPDPGPTTRGGRTWPNAAKEAPEAEEAEQTPEASTARNRGNHRVNNGFRGKQYFKKPTPKPAKTLKLGTMKSRKTSKSGNE